MVRETASPETSALSQSAKTRIAAGSRNRSIWWRIHQWAGLQISFFLAFVCITGSLAVFSSEIDWLVRPAMWAAPTSQAERVSWGEVARAAREHAPEADISVIYGPLHSAATFDVVMSGGERPFHVYVHPASGEVTGTGSWIGVQRFLRNTHRHLMLPVRWGVSLVSLTAFTLAISLVTSFWVYKKWWRGFFRLPGGRTARAYVGDLHRLGGLWTIWFMLLMSVTGIWYFIEQWGGGAPAANPAKPPEVFATPPDDLPPAATVFDAVDRATQTLQAQRPDFRLTQIIWSSNEERLVQLHGYSSRAILVRPRANTVWVDPSTGAIRGQADPAALDLHTRISEAADPLHFGTFGGYLTKAIWFLFGAALSALSITGVLIYALRLARAEGSRARGGHWIMAGWRAMGPMRWACLLLVLLPFALAPFAL